MPIRNAEHTNVKSQRNPFTTKDFLFVWLPAETQQRLFASVYDVFCFSTVD